MKRSTVRITFAPQSADGAQSFDSSLEWINADGSVEFAFQTAELHDSLWQAVIAYGLKQILADGGAVGRDIPAWERRAKMEKRAAALRDGSWSFRDGHGTETTARTSDSAIMYSALVAVAMFPDTPETREAWKALKPTERRAVLDAAGPDARAEYERRLAATAPAIDGSALLAKLSNH